MNKDDEETRTCGQCHKKVAEVNFSLHEMHCSRFLVVCPHCDETVPRDSLSQHIEEQHTQVKCSKCNRKMERCHLLDHEVDECVERLQICQFCQLKLPWKELAEHSLACGSRTELCGDCGRYVQLSQQALHSLTCPASDNHNALPLPATRSKQRRVRCGNCTIWLSEEERHKHELECFAAAKRDNDDDDEDDGEVVKEEEEEDEEDLQGAAAQPIKPNGVRSFIKAGCGPLESGGGPDQISTCPHCSLALPAFTLRWHQMKCQRYILMK